jgi:C-terminal processing protease CtpA/Prc
VGISIILRDGHFFVTSISPRGSAWRSKRIAVGNRILAINGSFLFFFCVVDRPHCFSGEEVGGMDLFDVGLRFLGAAGSRLNVVLEDSSGKRVDVSLLRAPFSAAASRQIRQSVSSQVSCRFSAVQMPAKAVEPSSIMRSLRAFNLGIVLEWTLHQSFPTVVNVAPASAAAKAKLVIGDILKFVNDTPVLAIGREGITAALKPIGKLLLLDVSHGDVDAPMQRRVINVRTSTSFCGS